MMQDPQSLHIITGRPAAKPSVPVIGGGYIEGCALLFPVWQELVQRSGLQHIA